MTCDECGRQFKGLSGLRIHQSRAHGNPEPSCVTIHTEGAETRSYCQFNLGITPSVSEIKCLLYDCLSTREIAKMFNVSTNRMAYHMYVLGIKLTISEQKRRMSNRYDKSSTLLNPKLLEKLYLEDKMSTYAIGELVGRGRDAVVRALNLYNIPLRRSAIVTWSHELLIRKLRSAGVRIEDWQINYKPEGLRYKIDIAFPDILFGIEVDGRSHFNDSDGYYVDRSDYDMIRDNVLEFHDWFVVHVTDQEVRYLLRDIVLFIKNLLDSKIHERGAPLQGDEIVRYSEEIQRRQG